MNVLKILEMLKKVITTKLINNKNKQKHSDNRIPKKE